MSAVVLRGDAAHLPLPDASIDAIVTDPPYGLEFMGREWDGADGFRRSLNAADAERDSVFGRTSRTSPEYKTGKPSGARIRQASEADQSSGRAHNATTSLVARNAPEAYVAGPLFQRWCEAWAAECLRVLKPGGYLLAFGGTRTWHRLVCGIEDAGFEIRDSVADLTGIDGPGLMWAYGSGFPKSLDVSKAIDKQRRDEPDTHRVTAFVAAARQRAGLTNRDIDAAFGFNGMAGHWTNMRGPQAAVPTWDQWRKLRDLLGFGDEMDAEVWRLNGRKGSPGEAYAQREVVPGGIGSKTGSTYSVDGGYVAGRAISSRGVTLDAARWEGWGTALKPGWEPIAVGRKPLSGTVAAGVLQYGTGALNIDGCRVGSPEDKRAAGTKTYAAGRLAGNTDGTGTLQAAPHDGMGRWPPNVILGPAAAEELDRQSGISTSAGGSRGGKRDLAYGMAAQPDFKPGLGDTGGASRYFPVFRHTSDDLVFFPVESEVCEQPGDGSTKAASTSAGRKTESSGGNSPTAGSGNRPMDLSPMDTRSTTGITTSSTMNSATSCASPPSGTTTTTSDSANSIDGLMASSSDDASDARRGSPSPSITSGEPEPGRDIASPANATTGASGSAGDAMSSTPADANAALSDSASPRFFPVFRYEAKADAAERPRLPDGTAWPTVKPVALMQWLVRLVTPPGGRVLDLFCGTGTTGEACAIEGFDCILIDRHPQAIALTKVRLARMVQPGLFRPEDSAPAAPVRPVAAPRSKPAPEVHPSLFDLEAS